MKTATTFTLMVLLMALVGCRTGESSGPGGDGKRTALKSHDLGVKRGRGQWDIHVVQKGELVAGREIEFVIEATGGKESAAKAKCTARLSDSKVLSSGAFATEEAKATYRAESKDFLVRFRLPSPLPEKLQGNDPMIWIRLQGDKTTLFTGVFCYRGK